MKKFENLVTQFERLVYTVCYRMMGNESDAMDMAQETFIKLYTSMQNKKMVWENDKALAKWLCRVASNRCVDELRKRKAIVISMDEMVEAGENNAIEDSAPLPEQAVLGKEAISFLQDAINSLPPEQKAAIVLRDVRGYSYEEIANMTQSTLGTVKSRISRGRENLKKFFKKNTEHN